jgi:cell wall-associated NlpC family hydrolase
MATGRHRIRFTRRQRLGGLAVAALLLLGLPLLFLTSAPPAPASAAPADAPSKAIAWAQGQMGRTNDDGLCLKFVYDAYRLGAGIDVRGGMATNANTSAVDFWNHFPQLQHRGDANPPAGAFVFWGARPGYPDGHVALSLGGQQVISTAERNVRGVHTFGLAARAGAYNYLGWMMPPGVPSTGGGTTPPPGLVFFVMNTSETPPDGVWFRDNPNAGGPRLNGYGVYAGDRVQLRCYGWGEAIGAYGNRLWYSSANLTRPNAPGRANVGWLNAHYVNDGQNANAVVPGVRPC